MTPASSAAATGPTAPTSIFQAPPRSIHGIAAGNTHACAFSFDFGVETVCWGDLRPMPWSPAGCRRPTKHRRGAVPEEWHFCPQPMQLPNSRHTRQIAMGEQLSCLLAGLDAKVLCWGDGDPPAKMPI